MGGEICVIQGLVDLSGGLLGPESNLGLDPLTTCVSLAHSGGEAGAARSHAQLHGGWRWR